MKFKMSLLAALVLSLTACTKPSSKIQLEEILTCQRSASPDEVTQLVTTLGGKAIVQHSLNNADVEFILPLSLDIFGRPVSKLSIHRGENSDGDFNEYSGIFSGEGIETVAKLAEIKINKLGEFRKQIGNHDLILRPESGVTYITCANDVRTIMKSIKRKVNG